MNFEFRTEVFNIFNFETVERQNGLNHQVETVISDPTYPDPFLNGVQATPTLNTASIRTREPNLRASYTMNSRSSIS